MKRKLLLSSLFLFFGWLLYAAKPLTDDYINNKYVDNWGKLKLVGTQLSSESGEAVQLKGWSTHGWHYTNVLKETFDSKAGFAGMKSFGANVARIAVYTSPTDGVNDAQVADIIDWVKRCMAWTYELNIYCIVDFHVHDPGFPTRYLEGGELGRSAEAFFREICDEAVQKGYNHILYEICNEPSNKSIIGESSTIEATWEDVKSYSAKILPIIEERDPNAVIIIGTPQACLRVNWAIDRPIPISENSNLNIMYSFHFYAGTHTIDNLKTAVAKIPVFATEWSVTPANGTGNPNYENSNTFTDFCRNNKISWCSWSWSGKNEKSAALKSNIRINNSNKETWIYKETEFTEVGLFIKGKIQESIPNSVSEVKNIQFGIYPNPTKDGAFTISLEENRTSTISISDMQGKAVFNSIIDGNEATIKTNLQTGVYLLTIKNENGMGIQKLVIE